MKKEIFLDVVFLSDYCMDFLFLFLLGDFIHLKKRNRGIVFGALLGALTTCFCLLLYQKLPFYVLNGIRLVSVAAMIKISYQINENKQLWYALAFMYILAFWTGGLWKYLSREAHLTGITFLIFFCGTYLLLKGIAAARLRLERKQKHIYQVFLRHEGRKCSVPGLCDTGNFLRDPVLHQPVSVIAIEVMKKLLSEEAYLCLLKMKENAVDFENTKLMDLKPRFILCHTIAGNKMLLAITIEELVIHLPKEKIQILHPVLAVSLEPSTLGKDYQIILNSELLDRGGLI